MSFKSIIINVFAKYTRKRIIRASRHASEHQISTFKTLIRKGIKTEFGRDHHFRDIKTHEDFIKRVPIRDYETLRPYIKKAYEGQKDILWPGKPLYFAKTSGTTSGVKYIPITRESIQNHIGIARDSLFNITALLNLKSLFDGKLVFLSGSPILEEKNGIHIGRLSGIVNHWFPSWLRSNQMPSYEVNCIEDWEEKVDRIVHETQSQDMRIISGIPPWVQMYYERLLEVSGKKNIQDLFPNFQLFVYGGVNFEPYRHQLERLTGGKVASLETYPASEGFIAYQDLEDSSQGLLLQCNSGIFYEFVPVEEIHHEHPIRLSLKDVSLGKDYALIMSTNAGLWAYSIGDTIQFVSKNPFRVKVTGRIKHFISAFGEHVIGREVEEALRIATERHPCLVNEFTVAPQVNPPDGEKPFHEWWIEFDQLPESIDAFAADLDKAMVQQNLYYRDLIEGAILQPIIIRYLRPGAFKVYMQSIGKLGGQNKVPRLSNDRKIATALEAVLSSS